MRRHATDPRVDWPKIVESQGLQFHTVDQLPYWDETACYSFGANEIDAIEQASVELNAMCLRAVQHVFDADLLHLFSIPECFQEWLLISWERDERTLYGRFDLSYREGDTPRLLEYNADTPTALLEAAVIQWHWLNDVRPGHDQFNSIHECLIEAWRSFAPALKQPVYFCALDPHLEDFVTVNYLRDTGIQAGIATEYIAIEDIGWNETQQAFVNLLDRPIETAFKLYPWEWMFVDEFGTNLLRARVDWFEAPWKALLSNKAILKVLWDLFPESKYLLPASFEPISGSYVCKPQLGREGANVSLVVDGKLWAQTDGEYEGPAVYQALAPLPNFDEHYPVVGSWMINGHACGIGVREDNQPITQNTSRFIPHYIE